MVIYGFGLSRVDRRACTSIENVSSRAILNAKGGSWDSVASVEGCWALGASISLLCLRSSLSTSIFPHLCGPFLPVSPLLPLQRHQDYDQVDRGRPRVARHLVAGCTR